MTYLNGTDATKAAAAAGLPGVHIAKAYANGAYGSGWTVRRLGYRTDPRRIHNGGHAHFKDLAEAQEWAGKRYGIEKWVRIKGISDAYFPAQSKQFIQGGMASE